MRRAGTTIIDCIATSCNIVIDKGNLGLETTLATLHLSRYVLVLSSIGEGLQPRRG